MSYVNSIGGTPVNPNPDTYSVLSISASVALGWAINGQQPDYPVTDRIDVTASTAGLTITMPDAREAGIGTGVIFYNYGANSVTINDFGANSITTVAAGQAKLINIVTNSTAAGSWRSINIGAGTSSADASALAGYGLTALAAQLSQEHPHLTYNSNQTIGTSHRAYFIEWTGGAGTFTLTDPSVLGDGWFFMIYNTGSGILALTPAAGQINDAASLNAELGEGFMVVTDGTDFFTVGKVASSSSGLTLLTKSVAGGTDVTLTSTEAAYGILYFTGLLTANINVIVPTAVRDWIIYNNTTGAYTLTVKTAAGTGIAVTQGNRQILACDGTNVVKANDAGVGSVTSVATGTGLSGGPITGAGTINIANTGVVAGSYGNTKLMSLSINAQGQVTAASDGTTASTAADVYAATVGLKNYVLNGDCMVGQRSAIAISSATYTYGKVDRFQVSMGGTGVSASFTQLSSASFISGYCMNLASASWTTGAHIFRTQIESRNVNCLNGREFIAGARIYHNIGSDTDFRIVIQKADALDDFTTVTTLFTGSTVTCPSGAYTSVSVTGTFGSTDCTNGLRMRIEQVTSNTAASKEIRIGDVYLCEGTEPANRIVPPYYAVLAECQRHLPALNSNNTFCYIAYGTAGSTATVNCLLPFKTVARIAPTNISYSDATHFSVSDGSTTTACTGVAINGNPTLDSIGITFSVASGLTQFRPYLSIFNNANGQLLITGAEL